MKEVKFEELIIQLFPNHELTKDRWSFELMQFSADDLIEFGKQVREATSEEFCQALLGVTLPAETVKKIGKIVNTTDRIKTEK